jgi:hypothetical protein
MTGQNGEPAAAQEQPQTAEERLTAIQEEIAEADQLPDPTSWESYGKPEDEPEDG